MVHSVYMLYLLLADETNVCMLSGHIKIKDAILTEKWLYAHLPLLGH